MNKGVSDINIKLKCICEIFMGIPEERSSCNQEYLYKCIQSSHLGIYDEIISLDKSMRKNAIQENSLVKKGDLLVKRLSPNYVNVIDENLEDTYAVSNIIIIRPKDNIDPNYLAYILEMQGLSRLNHFTKKGVTVSSVSKKELGEIMIPILPIEKQVKLGCLRQLSHKQSRLQGRLIEEQNKLKRATFQAMKLEGNNDY